MLQLMEKDNHALQVVKEKWGLIQRIKVRY